MLPQLNWGTYNNYISGGSLKVDVEFAGQTISAGHYLYADLKR